MEDTKTCKVCHEAKALDAFHLHPSTRDGRQPDCKQCHNDLSLARYHGLSPEAKSRRIAMIKARKYGMTLAEMQTYVADHDENCDVCGKPDTTHRRATWTRQLTFDHDHISGRLRGMLCSPCNLAIGQAGDDADLLRKLADYIERFR